MKHIYLLFLGVLCSVAVLSQSQKGSVYDADTREPLAGATIAAGNTSTQSAADGSFALPSDATSVQISFAGYFPQTTDINHLHIALKKNNNDMQQVIVSASRSAQKRSEAPVAISTVSNQVIQDTKAQRLDQLVNKVSGVNMASLGNELNQVAIRQPIGPNNRFLFLEDGLPLRTAAVFDHNALVEQNMAAASQIEIIKGPSSALYGAEAIGGAVNLITRAAPAFTSGYVSGQLNDRGYKRADGQIGSTIGKVGFILSGYYANQTDGPIQYSDFHKTALTARIDYHIDSATTWTTSVSYIDYFSDMYGNLDSAHFAGKNYSTQSLFTYRKSFALRARSTIVHNWNNHSTTSATLLYRDNSVKQNPSYAIGTYPLGGQAGNPVSPDTATGNINTNAFKSYGLFLQHVERFRFLDSKLTFGSSAELDPQSYFQDFIWVRKQNQSGVTNYVGFMQPAQDSVMANYRTVISNFSSYLNYDFSVAKGLRLSAALRYDAFQYAFVNALPGSYVTGGPSAIINYHKAAPKIGATYNKKEVGFYGTYSEGYVPPQLADVFASNTNNTYLLPQTFRNYEIGGWWSLAHHKLYIDYSVYLMNGTNEIITVQLPDHTFASQNAGRTRHQGIEYGINYRPVEDLYIRLSGTQAKHSFVDYVASGTKYNGYEMQAAHHFIGNAEVVYKPHYFKGVRLSIEEQAVGKYYIDNMEKDVYNGYRVTNVRAGYQWRQVELWVNLLNAFNTYYATRALATVYGTATVYTYNLGDPRALTFGIAYHFGKKP